MTELLKRIRKVLDRCRQYNLKLNRSKCEFGVKQITILGHVVSERGFEPDVAKRKPSKLRLLLAMSLTTDRFLRLVATFLNLFQVMPT